MTFHNYSFLYDSIQRDETKETQAYTTKEITGLFCIFKKLEMHAIKN